MKLIKLALFVALCLCCAGLALGLPKKKNKNNNNKVSNSELEVQDDSDLIPIPDHLLDDYNKNSGKIESEIFILMKANFPSKRNISYLSPNLTTLYPNPKFLTEHESFVLKLPQSYNYLSWALIYNSKRQKRVFNSFFTNENDDTRARTMLRGCIFNMKNFLPYA